MRDGLWDTRETHQHFCGAIINCPLSAHTRIAIDTSSWCKVSARSSHHHYFLIGMHHHVHAASVQKRTRTKSDPISGVCAAPETRASNGTQSAEKRAQSGAGLVINCALGHRAVWACLTGSPFVVDDVGQQLSAPRTDERAVMTCMWNAISLRLTGIRVMV